MKQQSLNFTDVEYMHRKKVTKREEFLESMDLPKREEIKSDQDKSQIDYRINIKPSLRLTKSSFNGYNWEKSIEHRKSATRCKVEHIFLIVKRQFGYSKVVYRGIAKNFNRFYVLFASTNIVMCLRAERSEEFALG